MADVTVTTQPPAQVRVEDGEDFAVTVDASASAQVTVAVEGTQGPPGSGGSGSFTGGLGIELVGNDIRMNIDELPQG